MVLFQVSPCALEPLWVSPRHGVMTNLPYLLKGESGLGEGSGECLEI
jgi:hypothetical protein